MADSCRPTGKMVKQHMKYFISCSGIEPVMNLVDLKLALSYQKILSSVLNKSPRARFAVQNQFNGENFCFLSCL